MNQFSLPRRRILCLGSVEGIYGGISLDNQSLIVIRTVVGTSESYNVSKPQETLSSYINSIRVTRSLQYASRFS